MEIIMAHNCKALVISCMDFRFQTYLRDWAVKNIGKGNYDLVSFAGASKDIDSILKMIELSQKLHGTSEVYLIHHEDCGAYGKAGTKELQAKDLQANKIRILTKLPQLIVKTYFLRLNGTFEEIE